MLARSRKDLVRGEGCPENCHDARRSKQQQGTPSLQTSPALGIPLSLTYSDPRLFATHTSNMVPALNSKQHRTAIRFSSPQLLLELRKLFLLADQTFSVQVSVRLASVEMSWRNMM